MRRLPTLSLTIACASLILAACSTRLKAPELPQAMQRIDHLVLIYAENHSFDNLYGMFPGADGIANASAQSRTQLDHDGRPLKEIVTFQKGKPSEAFPRMPNGQLDGRTGGPFRIDAPPVSRRLDQLVPSPTHLFYQNQEQINGGKNNLFAAMNSSGGWAMGYYEGSAFRLWQWAKDYTLADRFFMGAFGGSYLNHHYLICNCAPRFEDAPASMLVALDTNGKLQKESSSPSANDGAVRLINAGQVTHDGWSINTSQPFYQPSGIPPARGGPPELTSPKGNTYDARAIPPQTATTIGDTLSNKGVSWAWYAGGWNAAIADSVETDAEKRSVIYSSKEGSLKFQPHHQPFNYYKRFAPGTVQRAEHLKDGDDFLQAIESGKLPAVSFYKPAGRYTQHPSYTDVQSGDAHMADLLEKLRASPQWERMLIVVTYDENGGYWDHVAPPTGPGWGDRFGPGTRVPAIFVGPMVKRGYVDSTSYDTTSIAKFITRRWDLEPLAGGRVQAGDLSAVLLEVVDSR